MGPGESIDQEYEACYKKLKTDNVAEIHQALQLLVKHFKNALETENPSSVSSPAYGSYNFCMRFVKESSDCSELISIWNYQISNSIAILEIIVIHALALVLRFCKAHGIRGPALSVIHTITDTLMRPVFRNLSSTKGALIAATLKLLTAINAFDSSSTKRLQESFDFTANSLAGLLKMRRKPNANNAGEEENEEDKEAKIDVRTLYAQFIMSFLHYGDASVKKYLLEAKDVVSGLFRGMLSDGVPLVDFILSSLLNDVIMCNYLARSVKVSFFNTYVLGRIIRLYSREDLRGITHNFLCAVCTEPGVGVCFVDNGWYVPDKKIGATHDVKVYNVILRNIIEKELKVEDELQQQLTLRILRACPELRTIFWKSNSQSYEPALHTKWLSDMTLAMRVLSLPLPSLFESPPPLHSVADNLVPPPLSRSVLARALQHKSGLIKWMSCNILFTMLCKIERFSVASRKCIQSLTDSDSRVNWQQYLSTLYEELKKRLPDIQLILGMVHSIIAASDSQSTTNTNTNTTPPPPHSFVISVLRVLEKINKLFPSILIESRYDWARLIGFFATKSQQDSPELLVFVCRLLRGVGASSLKWWQSSGSSLSTFAQLLKSWLTSQHVPLQNELLMVLEYLLVSSELTDKYRFQARNILMAVKESYEGVKDANMASKFLIDMMDHCVRAAITNVDVHDNIDLKKVSPLLKTILRRCTEILKNRDELSVEKELMTRQFVRKIIMYNKTVANFLEMWNCMDEECYDVERIYIHAPGNRSVDKPIPVNLEFADKSWWQSYKDPFENSDRRMAVEAPWYLHIAFGSEVTDSKLTKWISDCINTPIWKYEWIFDMILVELDQNNKQALKIGFLQRMMRMVHRQSLSNNTRGKKSSRSQMMEMILNNMATSLVNHASTVFPNVHYSDSYMNTLMELYWEMKLIRPSLRIPFDGLYMNRFLCWVANAASANFVDEFATYSRLNWTNFTYEDIEKLFLELENSGNNSLKSYVIAQLCLNAIEIDIEPIPDTLVHRIHILFSSHTQNGPSPFDAWFLSLSQQPSSQTTSKILTKHLVTKLLQHPNESRLQTLLNMSLLPYVKTCLVEFIDSNHGSGDIQVLLPVLLGALNTDSDSHDDIMNQKLLQVLAKDGCLVDRMMSRLSLPEGQDVVVYENEIKTLLRLLSTKALEISSLRDRINSEMTSMAVSMAAVDVYVDVLELVYSDDAGLEDRVGLLECLVRYDGPFAEYMSGRVGNHCLRVLEFLKTVREQVRDVTDISIITKIVSRDVLEKAMLTLMETYIESPSAMETCRVLFGLYSALYHDAKDGVMKFISTMVTTVFGHDAFDTVMSIREQSEQDATTTNDPSDRQAHLFATRFAFHPSKQHISQILAAMAHIAPRELLRPAYIQRLVTLYEATTHEADKGLLELFAMYERTLGISLMKFCLFWGKRGHEEFSMMKDSLIKGAFANVHLSDCLELIDPVLMTYSYRKHEWNDSTESIMTYDMNFFLPLFATILSKSSESDLRKMLSSNMLGMITIAFSSPLETDRRVGHVLLSKVYAMIQKSFLPEKNQLLLLLNSFKNAIVMPSNSLTDTTPAPPMLPKIICLFIAEALSIFTRPDHFMYPHINRFLLQRPFIDIEDVPLFYTLFYGFSDLYKRERSWLLAMLRDGIGNELDCSLLKRRHVMDILCSYVQSDVCYPDLKKMCIEIIEKISGWFGKVYRGDTRHVDSWKLLPLSVVMDVVEGRQDEVDLLAKFF